MKLRIIIGICILIMTILIPTTFVIIRSSSSSRYDWEPTIIIDKDIIRVNEIVNITLRESDIIDNCTWEIDEMLYYGKVIRISFKESKNYSIKAISEMDGKRKTVFKNIDVYNQNEEYILPMKGFQNYRYLRDIGSGRVLDIKSGISYPNVEVHIYSDNALGILGPEIELRMGEDISTSKVLLYEKGRYFNEPLDFHETISSDVLNGYSLPLYISIVIIIEEGKIDDWVIEINVEYR